MIAIQTRSKTLVSQYNATLRLGRLVQTSDPVQLKLPFALVSFSDLIVGLEYFVFSEIGCASRVNIHLCASAQGAAPQLLSAL